MFIVILLLINIVSADEEFEAMKDEAIAKAKERRAEITAECKEDPYSCSCKSIPCEDLLDADHEQKEKAYGRCVEERNSCEEQRLVAIEKIEGLKSKIKNSCRKSLNDCSCNEIDNSDGRKECELAVIEAKYEAEKQKEEKIRECSKDLDSCDCDNIENLEGREECSKRLGEAKDLRDKVKKACESNPIACDCSIVKNAEGNKQCEKAKKEGFDSAKNAVKSALSKCFKDVDKCDCSNLELPEGNYVEFCEIQKSYGFNCRDNGLDCDKLDDVEIYPSGMPPWLGKFFAKTYSDFIDKEKKKAAKDASDIIKKCINEPSECECDLVPGYAFGFCSRMKDLQLKCYADDYDACLILEKSPNLPEGMPEFTVGALERGINKLRKAREGAVKSNAARKVGNMILDCMDSADGCDCSIAPKGSIRAFCEHKKELVEECRGKGNIDSCFTLDEEEIISEDMPDFIKDYVNKNVVPKVEGKKQKIYEEMRQGTDCASIETLKECKKVLTTN